MLPNISLVLVLLLVLDKGVLKMSADPYFEIDTKPIRSES
jgi:hypothetical protein